jgi:hypothetical protein
MAHVRRTCIFSKKIQKFPYIHVLILKINSFFLKKKRKKRKEKKMKQKKRGDSSHPHGPFGGGSATLLAK